MDTTEKLTIGYWKIRGLGRSVVLVCEMAGAPYELVQYEQGDAPDFDSSCWFDVKFTLGLDFPNLPYLIDGDFKMTETVPIMQYICNKYKPELLGETPKEKAIAGMLMNIVQDAKLVTLMFYRTSDKSEVLTEIYKKFAPIEKFLEGKKFILGDKVCYTDLHLYELLSCIDAIDGEGNVEKNFPNLWTLKTSVGELPEITAFVASDRNQKLLYNNKIAKINSY